MDMDMDVDVDMDMDMDDANWKLIVVQHSVPIVDYRSQREEWLMYSDNLPLFHNNTFTPALIQGQTCKGNPCALYSKKVETMDFSNLHIKHPNGGASTWRSSATSASSLMAYSGQVCGRTIQHDDPAMGVGGEWYCVHVLGQESPSRKKKQKIQESPSR